MKLEERIREVDELLMEGHLEKALRKLQDCLTTESEKILDNPYVHLRKGQCHYMLDQEEEAVREFAIAYTLDGERIFEDEDPRFWEFLKQRVSSEQNSGEDQAL
jgi:hypothetical protein